MKTIRNRRTTTAILAVLVLFASAPSAFAYPPDNAAVLYYRASLSYDANDAMLDKVSDLVRGKTGIDDEIREYVEKNRNAIKYFVDAGKAANCDWGMDYSEGMALQMPSYAPLRDLAKIVLADAKITAEAGDYSLALDRCLAVNKAAVHFSSDGILISHLVGISANALANGVLTDILPGISRDVKTLSWLKGQMLSVSSAVPSLKAAIYRDLQICGQDIRKERVDNILEMCGDDVPEQKAEIIRNGDEAFFEASRTNFLQYIAAMMSIIEQPYPQSHEGLLRLGEKPALESKENPHAILTRMLMPALHRCLSLDVRIRTHFNAVITALDLYVARAKTGRLPDALPQNALKDLFSGKDFEYEKTKDGFVLRCRGKDLDKDEIYEYEFKVKK
jgi:hypothetical protein